jgi:hypothetical protein
MKDKVNNRKKNKEFKRNKIGETSNSKFGTPMKILEYINSHKVLVEFQDDFKYQTFASYIDFLRGTVINPYDKRINGVGYHGVGKYVKTINRKATKPYQCWVGMIERCYDTHNIYPSYKDCTVCKEWHNFQNFAEWYENNYYEVLNEKMHIDKDILSGDNKVYSKETCIFVPEKINLIIKNNVKGFLYRYDKYHVIIGEDGKNILYGHFKTKGEAVSEYKQAKEKYIQKVAERYKPYIPERVYNALINYRVKMTEKENK